MIDETKWQTTFLNAGTEKGLGDLSMMIGTVSGIIDTALTAERERIGKLIKQHARQRMDDYLNDWQTQDITDIINLINPPSN